MFAALIFSTLLVLSAPADQQLTVAPLPRDGQVLVSFKLQQELTDELRTTIRSGMAVSFTYSVDLRRGSAIWFDRTLASVVIKATVKYNNLTGRYLLTRTLDNRMERPDTTDSEEVAWTWLTNRFDRLPLFSSVTLESNGEYYVRVSAHAAPGNAGFVWPWRGDDVVAFTKFTLIK
ncbi:MAG: DUF4390 domain-containing protein [Vicinamibacterales bacterium]